jgi:DNA-binding response OmpR family regulator
MSARVPDLPPRVLVVDDEPSVRVLLERILRSKGFEVKTAEGGQEGLELAQSRPFDLILLDVMMPGLDGKEVCARLKASVATASIPVIFVTALDDPATRAECMALGGADFVVKPVRAKDLVERARRAMGIAV